MRRSQSAATSDTRLVWQLEAILALLSLASPNSAPLYARMQFTHTGEGTVVCT